jgi:hypothetical protein
MELQSPPSTDPLAATPLLQPEEFRALTARMLHNERRLSTADEIPFYGGLGAIFVSYLAWSRGNLPIALIIGIASFLSLMLIYHRAKFNALKSDKETERLKQFLARTQDVGMLGPILDLEVARRIRGERSDPILPSIDATVLRLLPLVQTFHSGSLTSLHRTRIRHYLSRRDLFRGENWQKARGLDKMPFARGVLHALEQVGDKNDLPSIKSLVDEAAPSQELTAALLHCIATIKERVAREEGKEYLLRSGDNPDAAASLLHPTIERTDTPSDQLLRATDGQARPLREAPSSSDFQS